MNKPPPFLILFLFQILSFLPAQADVFRISNKTKFRDHGGVVWSGHISRYRLEKDAKVILQEDALLIADSIEIEGFLATDGYPFELRAREVKWGKEGRISGFEGVSLGAGKAPDQTGQGPAQPQAPSCMPVRGHPGAAGIDGQNGFAGMGGDCQGDGCFTDKRHAEAPKPLQVFAFQSVGQANISGEGQQGGNGFQGGNGQAGGIGARGMDAVYSCQLKDTLPQAARDYPNALKEYPSQGYADGQAIMTIINGHGKWCPGEKAGDGGLGGCPGPGGRGGRGGNGGAPVPISYLLGYSESGEIEGKFQAPGGSAGLQGPPGEFGGKGAGGAGGSSASDENGCVNYPEFSCDGWNCSVEWVKKCACQKEIRRGSNGMESDLPADIRTKFRLYLNDPNSHPDCENGQSLVHKPAGQCEFIESAGYYSCSKGLDNEVKDASENVALHQFSNLSFNRDDVEDAWYEYHWYRTFDFLLLSTIRFLSEGSTHIPTDAKEMAAFRKLTLKNSLANPSAAANERDSFDRHEVARKLWQTKYIDQIQAIGNEHKNHLDDAQRKRLAQALSLGLKLVEQLDGESDLRQMVFESDANLKNTLRHLKEYCHSYVANLKQSEAHLGHARSFFEIPACGIVSSYESSPYQDIQLQPELEAVIQPKTLQPSLKIEVLYYDERLLPASTSWLDQIWQTLLPKAWAETTVTIIDTREALTYQSIQSSFSHATRPLTAKGVVEALVAPQGYIDQPHLEVYMRTLAFMASLNLKSERRAIR